MYALPGPSEIYADINIPLQYGLKRWWDYEKGWGFEGIPHLWRFQRRSKHTSVRYQDLIQPRGGGGIELEFKNKYQENDH